LTEKGIKSDGKKAEKRARKVTESDGKKDGHMHLLEHTRLPT
jgi:hypothetical protein